MSIQVPNHFIVNLNVMYVHQHTNFNQHVELENCASE